MNMVEREAPKQRYFTGKPCKQGHISERFSGNRECVECSKERSRRDPNKAFRTKMSAAKNRAKRNADAKAWNAENPEKRKEILQKCKKKTADKIRLAQARYREKFAEKRRDYARARYASDKDSVRAATERWRLKNGPKDAARAARRKAAKLQATPLWADHSLIELVYFSAAQRTLKTGIPHEVDHIIPLQGEIVCGLHVAHNLQVLTKSENSRKKNRFIDTALSEPEGMKE